MGGNVDRCPRCGGYVAIVFEHDGRCVERCVGGLDGIPCIYERRREDLEAEAKTWKRQ